MQIKERGAMPNGTKIQIEDWAEDYSFLAESSTLAAYPTATRSVKGLFTPKVDERFRAAFDFENAAEAKAAFDSLLSGGAKLADYKDKIKNPDLIPALEEV